jgi:hypothetical protein
VQKGTRSGQEAHRHALKFVCCVCVFRFGSQQDASDSEDLLSELYVLKPWASFILLWSVKISLSDSLPQMSLRRVRYVRV